ncbi:Hypothetical protein CINCED_3A010805 [Cinara cedri]|uniref:Uncharacterized protein n=1 Tax=Cinara cedri TaxID=506608 RepID=A0A5E4M3V6_9HEMI|nr:Hypothetical protein CINCED_3A010805 [Cinara cedri]
MKTPPLSPQRKEDLEDANGDKDSSSNSGDVAAATNTSTSIGGRLTFYKDGKFIFQLAAHHQHQPYNNQSTITTPCRWVPVPTVLQQQKNNVKSLPVVITGSSTDTLSSPHKKYRSGQPEVLLQQQRRQDVDNSMKKTVLSLPQVLPANDHSITAILSGGESSSPPILVNNKASPVPYRHHTSSSSSSSSSSRKRSAVETTTIAPIPLVPVVGTGSIDHSARMSTMVIPPPTANVNVVNDPSVALTSLHQLPTLHLPNVASAAAADYFNVLYHQVAMAAIAYQTHPQLSKLQAPPSLLSSQYPSVSPSIVTPRILHQQQQYHPAPMVQQQQQRPLPYQHRLQHTNVGAKKRTLGTMGYDGGLEAKNLTTVDEESSSSTDLLTIFPNLPLISLLP